MSIPTAGAAAPIFSSAAATSLLSELTPLARDQMLAAERPAADQINFARAFAFRMVGAWWRALVEKKQTMQPLRECFFATAVTRLTSAQAKSADETGEAISCFALDIGVHQIGIVYMSMLPGEYRSAYGIYYTPAFLVHRLIEQATLAGIDWTCARILDPACGGGAFLAPVARQMVEELRDCSPRILVENIASRLCGYELDPFGAWLSQVTVDAILLPITYQAKKRLPVIVTVCDSLRKDALRETFDLVIGNPPYGRIQLDSATRDMYQRSLYGHANLYGLFTDLALRYAKSGGVIAYVTPTSFLAGEYFKKLRSLLACEAPPVSIDFIAARKGIFEDVLQETLLATYRRGAVPGNVEVHEISLCDGPDPEIKSAGSVALPEIPSKPWLLPRQSLHAPLVSRLTKMRHRLADWGYKVSTGPLVWNRHKDQLMIRPGGKRFPLIWAEAVTPDGQFVWRANKKNHAPYFEARRGDDWLITNTPCVLVQRTTAKEQARRIIAAALPQAFVLRHGAVVIENHLNMVRPIIKEPPIRPEILAVFLNSTIVDQIFRCVSGSVAVSAYELEALPLPPPRKMERFGRLVRDSASRDLVESACAELYDGAD